MGLGPGAVRALFHRRLPRGSSLGALALGLLICLDPRPGLAQVAAAVSFPETVRADLLQAGVAEGNAAFVVVPLDGGRLQLATGEAAPMNPASAMKLLTTYAALTLLGPDYRWHTTVLASRPPKAGRIDGDLIVRGDGDPSLVIERWWLLVQRLRALGIRDIRGDLVLDRTRYPSAIETGPSLDHNDLRPYNVAPDALLINFKALSLEFVPDVPAGVARIIAMPQLDGVHVPSRVPLGQGPCGDWKGQLQADFSAPKAPRFRGTYAAACGVQSLHVSTLSPNEYALASFRTLWRQAGGSFHGGVREGRADERAIGLLEQPSPPLAEVIRDINKHSNNVMARQLFLTLSGAQASAGPPAVEPGGSRDPAQATGVNAAGTAANAAAVPAAPAAAASGQAAAPTEQEPATAARSIDAVHKWLDREGLSMPELVLENGSGLSRLERISASSLGRLLVRAWNSADMPTFLASLPLAGVDGTMKRRKSALHAAYVKTGYLADVRALAGYVFAASGHRYVIVSLINDAHADAAQGAIDDFLQWVWQQG